MREVAGEIIQYYYDMRVMRVMRVMRRRACVRACERACVRACV